MTGTMGQSAGLNPEPVPGTRGPFQPGEGHKPLAAEADHPAAHMVPANMPGSVFSNPYAGQGVPGMAGLRALGFTLGEEGGKLFWFVVGIAVGGVGGYLLSRRGGF